MANVVILGGGLTGLSTAYHLEKNHFFDFKIFEKEATVGGLCRSITQDGFTFDYTGHLLHASDAYFSEFLASIVGLENLAIVKRRSFIYSHGTYTHFPFQVNLYGLPAPVIIECIEGFIKKDSFFKKNPRSFYDWALQKFGAGVTKHFFSPYQEKIFAYDIHKITASWTGRFVPETSLQAILQGALSEPKEESIGYNANFFYPKRGGINFWVDRLAQQIKSSFFTNHTAQTVDLKNKVVTFTNGTSESFELLVNTLPIDIFLSLLKTPASSSLKQASKKLLCNSVINFNLGFNRPNISDKHWIYLPEKSFIPYRIGFYHNFSQEMVPHNCSSLYGEIAFLKTLPQNQTTLIKKAQEQLKQLLGFSDSDICTQRTIHIPHAYVIFDFWRERNLPKIHTALAASSIYSIGRYGAWKYASMQESLLDGKEMAEKIVNESTSLYPAKIMQTVTM